MSGPLVDDRLSGSAAFLRGRAARASSATSTIPITRSGATTSRRLAGSCRLALGTQGELLLSGDVTPPGSDAAHLRQGAGGEAWLHGRQPAEARARSGPRRSRRAGTCSTERSARFTLRMAPATTLDQPDGVPQAGLPRARRHGHHRAGPRRVGRARDPAPVVRGARRSPGGPAALVGRRPVPAGGRRPPADVHPPRRARKS